MSKTYNAAVSATAVADLIIFAMSGSSAVPTRVERWVEMWTGLLDSRQSTVIALFSTPHIERANTQTYLQRVAASKGLDFFPRTTRTLAEPRCDAESAASERSSVDGLGGNVPSVFTAGAMRPWDTL